MDKNSTTTDKWTYYKNNILYPKESLDDIDDNLNDEVSIIFEHS